MDSDLCVHASLGKGVQEGLQRQYFICSSLLIRVFQEVTGPNFESGPIYCHSPTEKCADFELLLRLQRT